MKETIEYWQHSDAAGRLKLVNNYQYVKSKIEFDPMAPGGDEEKFKNSNVGTADFERRREEEKASNR